MVILGSFLDSVLDSLFDESFCAEVAQLVEQPIRNRQVPGSSPGLGSNIPFVSAEFALIS